MFQVGGLPQKEGTIRLLGSRLARPQQNQLTQLARLLGGQHVDSFSSTGISLLGSRWCEVETSD